MAQTMVNFFAIKVGNERRIPFEVAADSFYSESKKTLKKINRLIRDIQRNPFEGIGHPELLSGNLAGWRSRHVDEKNRIVYKSEAGSATIPSCKNDYYDK